MEKKAYVERIMAFITNQQTGRQEEGGEPTPVPPGPQPIITIDGVDYYHKCEFDLEEIFSLESGAYFNLLNAQMSETAFDTACLNFSIREGLGNVITLYLRIPGHGFDKTLMSNAAPWPVNYTSKAFVPVDTDDEVSDDNKILLPTCSAYYGFLSEDGKTFISYFNLKD